MTSCSRSSARLDELALQRLTPVINATGIILHTNLGRAPLAPEALDAVDADRARLFEPRIRSRGRRARLALRARRRASCSEVDRRARFARRQQLRGRRAARARYVCQGARSRSSRAISSSRSAAASASPRCLERSGATLVEVGTTNRVYIEDFERALSPRTALLLRTHPSNYRIEGFTHDVGGTRAGRSSGAGPASRSSKTSAAARSSISRSTARSTSARCRRRLPTASVS